MKNEKQTTEEIIKKMGRRAFLKYMGTGLVVGAGAGLVNNQFANDVETVAKRRAEPVLKHIKALETHKVLDSDTAAQLEEKYLNETSEQRITAAEKELEYAYKGKPLFGAIIGAFVGAVGGLVKHADITSKAQMKAAGKSDIEK